MAVVIVVCGLAAFAAFLYFFLTAGKKSDESGAWIKSYRYAHRGLHNAAFPENTIPAFRRAAERGYGIELDVRLSGDGRPVVFHDDTLDRVTERRGRVEDYTAEELAKTAVLGTQYTIPLFEDALAAVAGKTPILIETKNEGGAGPLEAVLFEALKGYEGKFAIQSFSPFSVGWFYKNAPHIPRGQLSSRFTEGAAHIAKYKRFMIRHLLTNFLCRPQFISYEADGAGDPAVRLMRRRGLIVLAWTVRGAARQSEAERYADTVIFEGYEAKKHG